MKKIFLPLMIFMTLFITTACSPMTAKYRVTVDAITAPNLSVAPTTYTVKALGTNTDANSLTFQQQARHLTKMLNAKGYTMATYPSIAAQVIYFDYGIEKVKEASRIYSQPDVTFGISWGYPYGYYGRYHHPFYPDFWYGGYTTYRQTTTYYNRYITLLAKEQTGKELWRVDVSSVGESKNLKKIVPMLLEAAEAYIGTNTDEPVKLIMKENLDKKE